MAQLLRAGEATDQGQMTSLEPKDPQFETRVRASFARQQTMTTLGVEIVALKAGEIELKMPHAPAYTQQHGFVHAGIIATALDSACGYAAFSLMPAGAAVLTVEFKTNLAGPGKGRLFLDAGPRREARAHNHRLRWPGFRRACRDRKTRCHHDRHADGAI